MAKIIAFVSQSGNVMKSSLACGMALEAVNNDITVSLVDLDREHRTASGWMTERKQADIDPVFNVIAVDSAKQALDSVGDEDLFIIDAPSRASKATVELAKGADLVVQPTTPGKKDLDLSITTFYQLVEEGVDINRLLLILTRFGTPNELLRARHYVQQAKIAGRSFRILKSSIPEKTAYRMAINDGFAITETSYRTLNENARSVIHQTLTMMAYD